MFFRAKIWSVHPLSLLNPACSSLRVLSTADSILPIRILQKTFDGIDSSVIPRQLSVLVVSFLGDFDNQALVPVVRYCLLFPDVSEEAC